VCSHCTKPCGAQVLSRIELSSCAEGANIGNSAGTLACTTPHAADVPEGTYQNSCTGCTVEAGMLVCEECNKSDLTVLPGPSIAVGDCSEFGNSNGQLTCDQWDPARRRQSEEEASEAQQQEASEAQQQEASETQTTNQRVEQEL